jgi:CheY-like chemotaxis protein
MDLNMPALDGIQSTRIIKSLPNTKHIPIFMLTMESEKGAVVKAIQVGAKDYIIKSMSKDFVLKRIGDFFSSGVQRKQA